MVSKVEREQAAIAAAENDLAERKKRLAELKKEEAEKAAAVAEAGNHQNHPARRGFAQH